MTIYGPTTQAETSPWSYSLFLSFSVKYLAYGALLSLLCYCGLSYSNLTDQSSLHFIRESIIYASPAWLLAVLDADVAELRATDKSQQDSTFKAKLHTAKALALKRMLRFNNQDGIQAVHRKGLWSGLGNTSTKVPSIFPPGLGNLDNSCYQNSVLQGLASLKALPSYLDLLAVQGMETTTGSALKELSLTLNDNGNNGSTIWTPHRLKSMNSWQQQDAQEYYSKLVDEIMKDGGQVIEGLVRDRSQEAFKSDAIVSKAFAMLKELPEEIQSSVAQDPLHGMLAQRVGCLRCGHVEGLTMVPFNCLTLPLSQDWATDVATCLDRYTALEPINGVECVKCSLVQSKSRLEDMARSLNSQLPADDDRNALQDSALKETVHKRLRQVNLTLENGDLSENTLKQCSIGPGSRVSSTKSRQAVVARAPEVLVLHFNRSEFDELTGLQSKNYAKIEFELNLDLKPWCLGSQVCNTASANGVEQWTLDPSKTLLSTTQLEPSDRSGFQYRLKAVITHYGRHENGHYICYRRSSSAGSDSAWWRFSDEDVTEVSEDILLAQGGVFMLFYEVIENDESDENVDGGSPPQQNDLDLASQAPLSPILHHAQEMQGPGKTSVLDNPNDDDSAVSKGFGSELESESCGSPSSGPQLEDERESTPSPPSLSTSEPLPNQSLLTPPSTPVLQGLPKLSPRSGRDGINRPRSAMENVAGYIQAN